MCKRNYIFIIIFFQKNNKYQEKKYIIHKFNFKQKLNLIYNKFCKYMNNILEFKKNIFLIKKR